MDFKRLQTDWAEPEQQQLQLEEILPKHPIVQTMQPYYRSKAFVSEIGINPLIAAAAPLFFLLEKTQQSGIPLDAAELRESFVHEIKAFDNQAQTHGYKPNIVLAAHFALGLWIDEMILNTTWGKESSWEQQALVDHNAMQAKDSKSIFFLLNHCLQDPSTYIDLLELLYLCLSLGYEGEYRYLERGHILLSEIRDNVYQHIQRQRGEISKKLEIEDTSTLPQVRQDSALSQLVLRGLSILVTATTLVLGYLWFNSHLQNTFDSTEAALQQWAASAGQFTPSSAALASSNLTLEQKSATEIVI